MPNLTPEHVQTIIQHLRNRCAARRPGCLRCSRNEICPAAEVPHA